MSRATAVSVARNALRPGFAREMLRKVAHRARARLRNERREDSVAWARARAEPLDDFARSLDPGSWAEAERFGQALQVHADRRLSELGHDLGGGGDHRLLYFLVRYLAPAHVVETGVAAGFSSAAILRAMEENGIGRLHSSDFPYFRLPEPERYVGWIVEEHLRDRWRLEVRGDRVNLPLFASEVGRIDLLHYDSDKSYEGRAFALSVVGARLAPDALIVFDDIQDNFHFRDWTEGETRTVRVFEFGGKWVGMVGL